MSVEKYEKDEQIKKVRPMNTSIEGEIQLGGCAQLYHRRGRQSENAAVAEEKM